jgi:beta-ureidopropionase / N-carbamoyl-L-amino-acid hydrolase
MSNKTLLDRDRLWADIIALGEITDPARPYTRRSFSALFLEGRDWLAQRFGDAGLSTYIDAAGNLIGRRDGTDPTLGTIIIGSHSDSVPSGGRFDGMAGVIAGLAIARDLHAHGIALRHNLEVVDFLAEEPSEYGISCVGSRGLAGMLSPANLELSNKQDETLETALTRMGGDPSRLDRAIRIDIAAAFELHIEQGPVLEARELDIGIVTSIVGITRIEITFQGTAGHAGTTPMTLRRDPLIAAAGLIGWIRDTATALATKERGHFVATTGIVEVLPNASNVIPKTARIVIDARSEDRELMEEFCRALDTASVDAASAANVDRVRFERLSDSMPAVCDPVLRSLLSDSAAALGCSSMEMASGAGHDTAFMSLIAPAAMVFIPCKKGRSHTPEEWTTAAQLARGTEVMLGALLRFDRA